MSNVFKDKFSFFAKIDKNTEKWYIIAKQISSQLGGNQVSIEFVPALSALKNAPSDQVISKLNDLFTEITKMTADSLVANYQTITTTAELTGLSEDKLIQIILKAIRERMSFVLSQTSMLNRAKTAKMFRSVTNYDFLAEYGPADRAKIDLFAL